MRATNPTKTQNSPHYTTPQCGHATMPLCHHTATTPPHQGRPTVKRAIVVCPCSLVNNWAQEFEKWINR